MNARWLTLRYEQDVKSFLRGLLPDRLLERNVRFRDVHRGERCFILGSGPSIAEQDMTRLAGEIVMTQNHFHAHEQIGRIAPRYHVIVPKYQPREYDADWVAWLNSMNERLPQDTVLFFDKNTKYLVDDLGLFASRAYYMQTGYSGALLRRAPVDITKRIMVVPTVITQCLAVAIYMGFREIYLVGFDLDQVCRMSNRDKVRFYGLSPITANKAEIDAEAELASTGRTWSDMWIIWQQLIMLRQVAKERGISIVNATRGGLLDMFPRRRYEDLV